MVDTHIVAWDIPTWRIYTLYKGHECAFVKIIPYAILCLYDGFNAEYGQTKIYEYRGTDKAIKCNRSNQFGVNHISWKTLCLLKNMFINFAFLSFSNANCTIRIYSIYQVALHQKVKYKNKFKKKPSSEPKMHQSISHPDFSSGKPTTYLQSLQRTF